MTAQHSELRVIDSHTGGEPTRQVVDRLPDLGTGSMAERRAAPKPAPAGLGTGPALRPSMLAQASMAPRPSFPSGGRSASPPDEGRT